MRGYLTYFFEQHKRMILGYSVMTVIALIFAVSLKTTSVPASLTILYVSVFASLAPVASLNSDREIDELLSLPGGRKNLVKAQYLNAVFAVAASIISALLMILLTYVFTLGKAHLPSPWTMTIVVSVAMSIVAVMLPLSMVFGKKGLLIGFAAIMFVTFQTVVRILLTNGGTVIFQLMKEYLVGHQIEGISLNINESMVLPDLRSPFAVFIAVSTALTVFVSSYIIARLVFSRKNFQVNKL